MSWHDPYKEDTAVYKVVLNHEEQYSIWPEYKENPLGWKEVGKVGLEAECLAYIKEAWTDMRPLSVVLNEPHSTGSNMSAKAQGGMSEADCSTIADHHFLALRGISLP